MEAMKSLLHRAGELLPVACEVIRLARGLLTGSRSAPTASCMSRSAALPFSVAVVASLSSGIAALSAVTSAPWRSKAVPVFARKTARVCRLAPQGEASCSFEFARGVVGLSLSWPRRRRRSLEIAEHASEAGASHRPLEAT